MRLTALVGPLAALPLQGDVDLDVQAVVRDSRQAGPGVLFAAIRGASVDGHALVPSLPAGSAVLVERPVNAPPGVAVLQVADTRVAFAVAAAVLAGRPADRLRVVGVTGTNGKTTVTTVLQQVLEAGGAVTGRIGTTGTRLAGVDLPGGLTTPEAPDLHASFARLLAAGGDVCAIEVSSIGLDQRRVEAIPFHLGVFTNLQRDHLDHHGTMEAYAAAKARLFRALLRPPGGAPRALLYGDDGTWQQMHPPEDRWLYGFERTAQIRIGTCVFSLEGMRAAVHTPAGAVEVVTPLVGLHNLLNVAAVVGIGVALGVGLDRLAQGLAVATGAPGRMERVPNDRGLLVLVDYAHTPDALAAAVDSVRAAGRGRVHLVFGCGGDRDRGKRPQMGVAALRADRAILTSDNPRSEAPEAIAADVLAGLPEGALQVELDRRLAIQRAIAEAAAGDTVLIAGKGHEAWQEVAGLRLPFDDRAEARSALEAR